MITRIELDGFKSFRNFSLDLMPFQILIGANGVGKSNLFDAIVLLSDMARDFTLYEAFRKNRGEIQELFTLYPDGTRARQMKLAVELLIDRTVSDHLGITADVTTNRLRYEIEIERADEDGFGRLFVTHESLTPIAGRNDRWVDRQKNSHHVNTWILRSKGRRGPYISTTDQGGIKSISKHQDGRSGKQQLAITGRAERTVLSSITSVEYPTAYAVRQEMLNWRFLQFNPARLRMPASVYAPTRLDPDGSNLATVLDHMKREDEYVLTDISLDMANTVPGIQKIVLETLRERQEHQVKALTTDGSLFSSQVLSDGTLRILALVTLKNDPRHHGVLCFEEPENGVHPSRLEAIIEIFRNLSTNFEQTEESPRTERLRQVLINTHSPKLLSCANIEDFIVVYTTNQRNNPRTTRAGRLTSEVFPYRTESADFYTLAQIREYLDAAGQHDMADQLNKISGGV